MADLSASHVATLAGELRLRDGQVRAAAVLLDEGASVPFIARYRKEATGSLDEVAIAAVRDRLAQLRELDKRRQAILGSLDERGLLTDALRAKVLGAETLAALEDVYLPYRPKRRTRATVARERGLEPLAEILWRQDAQTQPRAEAARFVDAEKGVHDVDAALAGARDVMAEWASEDAAARAELRRLFDARATLRSRVAKGKEEAGAKFRDYFAWEEPAARAPSHRVLAMLRGEAEGILSVGIAPPPQEALDLLERRFVRGRSAVAEEVRAAIGDGYKRLLAPSMDTETRKRLKERADETAIAVFADNLRNLLLAPPLGEKAVLAIDPGFRTGCKVVCLDAQGKLLAAETVYLHLDQERTAREAPRIAALARMHGAHAIAIGNGTAGRETEAVVRGLGLDPGIPIVMVNENGASVYSASEVAREELPDQDVTVRGAVSIGRRFQDPLAELVKIDPRAIGVGQYQHDVDPAALEARLRDVVASCVNAVGVDLNTASRELLTYVSGLGRELARAIVEHRGARGPFRSRQELRKVPRLGPKAFQQAAGFLRVRGGRQPLDASAVHPESYAFIEAMAAALGSTVPDLLRDAALRERIDVARFVTAEVGLPTLHDILAELAKPGRDPRERFEPWSFAPGIGQLADLKAGMALPGVVTNVTAFGAFVDIGVHQDGLVHVSQLANRFVADPREVVKVGQRVTVTVLEVDTARKRISLTMKGR